MSVWDPVPSTAPSGWDTAPTDAQRNWKHERPKAPVRKPIILESPTATLLDDDGPTKIPKLDNGMLFDLLPMDIINFINDWLVGLEH